jgi:hypothetical protein
LNSYKMMLAAGAAALSMTTAAHATVINVYTSVAPNAFGSPSYAPYVANATGAIHDGAVSRGNSSDPSYYHQQSSVQADQVIVTGFPSWMGKVDPGTVFGSAYTNELGNRMLFGLRVDGQGQKISIDQLSFNAFSTDAGNELGFGFGAGSYGYSNDYMGVNAGADGILWTSDDTFVTSGLSSQLVDGIVGRGSGNADAAYCSGCTLQQQQAAIDAAAAYWSKPAKFTGTYTYGTDVMGSGTFDIGVAGVPEPATWALMVGGFGLAGVALRRRKELALTA